MRRPVLRYPGGKFLLAPWVIKHFPKHRIYTEVYGGAASILLRKDRSYAEVYNDIDGEVVSLFRVLQDASNQEKLRNLLELTPFSREEFQMSYQPSDDAVIQAQRTIIRSFMGFGSDAAAGRKTGFRANSNRSGTTPAKDWMNYPETLWQYTERLRGVVIENKSALDILKQHDTSETLHYVDPPYPTSTRQAKLYRHEMNDEDHIALAKTLRTIEGMVVLSGYPCDLYDKELYADWHRYERQAFADGARKRTEVLWLNCQANDKLKSNALI